MALKINASISCFTTSLSSPSQCTSLISKVSLQRQFFPSKLYIRQHLTAIKAVQPWQLRYRVFKLNRLLQKRNCFPVVSEDVFPDEIVDLSASDTDDLPIDFTPQDKEGISSSDLNAHYEENGGKPGFVSFYNSRKARESQVKPVSVRNNQKSLLWFAGPAVLVASFILPSLYLRRIISTIFEDSLLTDFLILFFTEALFYCGVAVFVLLIDYLWRPAKAISAAIDDGKLAAQMGHRISSVTTLVLSLIIPMVTMGFVWPWTGPAASAALAPYLVGIIVQFAFEQYARYAKSPSLPVLTVVFQVYRLHQLNRAAQLVTALSFTIRGAEMTAHNLAINSSLGTLLNVLQFLGLICIWSLSSFVMKFLPSTTTMDQ